MGSKNDLKINKMTKVLKVISPFFVMEVGDTFVLSEKGDVYVSEHNEEFHKNDDSNSLNSSYKSTFCISPDYAQELIKEGYLENVEETQENRKFVNVFDEIQKLIVKYSTELKNLPEDMKDYPECVKVERATVLNNLLEVLNYLKNLRK